MFALHVPAKEGKILVPQVFTNLPIYPVNLMSNSNMFHFTNFGNSVFNLQVLHEGLYVDAFSMNI